MVEEGGECERGEAKAGRDVQAPDGCQKESEQQWGHAVAAGTARASKRRARRRKARRKRARVEPDPTEEVPSDNDGPSVQEYALLHALLDRYEAVDHAAEGVCETLHAVSLELREWGTRNTQWSGTARKADALAARAFRQAVDLAMPLLALAKTVGGTPLLQTGRSNHEANHYTTSSVSRGNGKAHVSPHSRANHAVARLPLFEWRLQGFARQEGGYRSP